jgi:hypothetical protein
LKKLVQLKKWLTISEAARHLSILFGEDVSEADVLRLALDGELKLSVYFLHGADARCGPLVPLANAKRHAVQSENGEWKDLDGTRVTTNLVLEYASQIASVDGVWDLSMLGLERLEIERRYHNLTGGPEVSLASLVGPIVHRDEGTYCELIDVEFGHENNESRSFLPAFGGLPEQSVLVVCTSALQEFEARLSEPERRIDKPMDPHERPTLLVMIAALANLAKIDWKRPSKAAAAIESQAALMGVQVGLRTIENHLKLIPEALANKAN